MELLLTFSLVLFAFLAISFTLNYIFTRKVKNEKTNLPPGNSGWPVIGETLEYFSKLKDCIPEQFATERMKKYSTKVFRTNIIGHPTIILAGVEGNKFLFSNENKLVQAWWPATMDKIFPKSSKKTAREEFIKVKKMLHSFLKADGLQKYVEIMDLVMRESLERDWKGKNEVLAGEVVKKYTFALACRVVLGIDDSEKLDKLAKPVQDIAKGVICVPINFPGTALNQAINSSKVMRLEIKEMIKKRKIEIAEKVEQKKNVLSTLLLASCDENSQFMNDGDISSHIVGLFSAGFDTLNSPLSFIMMYLVDYPDIYEKVLSGIYMILFMFFIKFNLT
ncbi:dammarenediol 12-hydroxylase-like [Impatiens glandulifera]|uniref:dammarenediol 12-hydroxylase-like n=1 Tax=Impatiens glandulifera TaxID=253017 RepID=UPI001FB0879E|nr:dammarenediol 12-hydroxylase-like [Impatiens glandulifera]